MTAPPIEALREGPTGYENWRSAIKGEPARGAFEFQLYSDAHLTDEVRTGCGPYAVLNAVPAHALGMFTHVATLRVQMHQAPNFAPTTRTDFSRYHGGGLTDELSALCSLLVGIRLKAGRETRIFDGGDPLGRVCADTSIPASPLPAIHRGWVVPRAHGSHDVRAALIPRLGSYPTLSPPDAISLVRAARLYQDAIWVSEAEPELAWLMLVAAVEVVATQHQVTSFNAEEILFAAMPGLHAELLRVGGEAHLTTCAKSLERHLRATNRFLSFLDAFLPTTAPPRPSTDAVTIPWDKAFLRKAFAKIYNYRSLALHDGTPFPGPMCDPPNVGGWHHERPAGLASATSEAAWMSDDMPMLLHVFEHAARHAILQWWDSAAAAQLGH